MIPTKWPIRSEVREKIVSLQRYMASGMDFDI